MIFLDNAVDRRAGEGNFPSKKLYPVFTCGDYEIDFENEASDSLHTLSQNPDHAYFLLTLAKHSKSTLDVLGMPELYTNEINCYINLQYREAGVALELYQKACELVPVVTTFDKLLWCAAFAFHKDSHFLEEVDRQYDPESMALAWIYLLRTVQEKELLFRTTINFDAVPVDADIMGIIFGDWESYECDYFVKMTDSEINRMNRLAEKRKILLADLKRDRNTAEQIAQKTDEAWRLFIEILNDLARKEAEVIEQINSDISAKDKLRSINEYDAVLLGMSRGRYEYNGERINLLDVFEPVDERLRKALSFCRVHEENGDPFNISPLPFALLLSPETYNYLYIVFHQFRMAPSKETARKFVELALKSIRKNLGAEEKKWVSLNDMIEDFHSTVMNFMQRNKEAIDKLSFDKLQRNAVIVGDFYQLDDDEHVKNALSEELRKYAEENQLEKLIEDIFTGKQKAPTKDEALEQINRVENSFRESEEISTAKRVIVSLNIIYLFCDALRIMLTNKRAHVKINKDATEQYRRDLLRLDDTLVHRVYSHLGEKEMGMLEYREKAGIISNILSEQEHQEESLRNSAFSVALKDVILNLTDSIEAMDAEGIIRVKKQIKDEILRFPGCDEKEQYADWIDSISIRIGNALINYCKQNHDDYDAIKKGIIDCLGEKSNELPNSTLDSLTTAEMLYGRYATDEFADKGFDFSCISALYYQAFEDAYNALIWRGYADKLNDLKIKGKPFTDILKNYRNKELMDPDHFGYLHKESRQRNYYVQFPSKEKGITTTSVSTRCMYKSFGILMESVEPLSELEKYCDYFAGITGFTNRDEMFKDKEFMKLCEKFTKAVNDSADNRNNASHGGTFISKTQCSEDKKTVLNNLESVRSSSIGLIQQLLYLLYKN